MEVSPVLPPSQAIRAAAEVLGVDPSEYQADRIGRDRGVFSDVWRIWSTLEQAAVSSVVVKMPRSGPNGDAARRSGAYDRERLAYTSLLHEELPAPLFFGVSETPDGPAIVLEDLTPLQFIDQIGGLDSGQVLSVVDSLARCHRRIDPGAAVELGVRRNTPSSFSRGSLALGLPMLPAAVQPVFRRLVDRMDERVADFSQLSSPVLCHGDPRADNVAFTDEVDGPVAILYDWQQIAIQAGEADLAWLLATSVDSSQRRALEPVVFERYGGAIGRNGEEVAERYRSAMIVPGLAVLLLAQRRAEGRLGELVRVSIDRIATAAEDHLTD